MELFFRGKPSHDTRRVRRRSENSESEFCTGLQRAASQPQHTTRRHPPPPPQGQTENLGGHEPMEFPLHSGTSSLVSKINPDHGG